MYRMRPESTGRGAVDRAPYPNLRGASIGTIRPTLKPGTESAGGGGKSGEGEGAGDERGKERTETKRRRGREGEREREKKERGTQIKRHAKARDGSADPPKCPPSNVP